MRRQRILIFLFVMLAATATVAQRLKVVSMRTDAFDVTASTYQRLDINGNPCALLKVAIPLEQVTFEGNVIGAVENKNGEYWVYMSEGTKEIRVKQRNFLPIHIEFKDYDIKQLNRLVTYVLEVVGDGEISGSTQSQQTTTIQQMKLPTRTNSTTTANGSATIKGTNHIAFINSSEIIQAMPEYKEGQRVIKKLAQQYEGELKLMQEELQRHADAFEKEEGSLHQNTKQQRQQQLQEMYQKIQQVYQDDQQALNSKQQELIQPIQTQLLGKITQAGEENGMMFIIDNDSSVYVNESLCTNMTDNIGYRLGSTGKVANIDFRKPAVLKMGWLNYEEILRLKRGSADKELLFQQVREAVATVAQRYGYSYIFLQKTSLPYVGSSITDVTPMVKHLMNMAGGIPTDAGVSTTLNNGKFAYINSQDIITAMPEYQQAKREIEALSQQYQNDLQSMQNELQAKAAEFERQQSSLPENIKKRRELELQQIYEKLQQYYKDNQQALNNASTEKMQQIQQKVLTAVAELGRVGNYAIVFDKSGGIPYISSTLLTDLTSQVKSKLGL